MPARRKSPRRSPRRSKSRSKSPRRVLKRRSSGKARTSRRATTRRSPKRRTYKGVDARVYGADVGANDDDVLMQSEQQIERQKRELAKLESANKAGTTEDAEVVRAQRTRAGTSADGRTVRQRTRAGTSADGRTERQRRVNADADEGEHLLWQSRYLEAVDGIRAIIQQLEERDNTTIERPPILDMVVEEGGYKDAAEHARKVLNHLQEVIGILTSTDEAGSSAAFAPTDEELALLASGDELAPRQEPGPLASNRSAASSVSDLGDG